MEDVTDSIFRKICKNFGADMLYTEFVSSDGLIRNVNSSIKKLNITDEERPIGIQIYGHLIDAMVEAAKIAEEAKPELIDINFGCPVKKIVKRGAGSGMMNDVPKMVKMTQQIVKAVKLPVTVKTRLGYDDDNKNIVEIAERLQDVGIQAITIHGRTRSQMYKGVADWTLIGEVKNNPRMKIPIIGNGDIDSPEKAKLMFDTYGVDAIMIGRATVGRPWIFEEIKNYLNNNDLNFKLSLLQKVEIVKNHLVLSIQEKGEKIGILLMRRHFAHYFKNLPNFRETKIRLLTSLNYNEIISILDEIALKYID
ncbi:MAG: tRNA dihydrouridine synthase DusB [Bacteroidetes bacterium GWA2_30_7]|nr:MAG: tRNA dihydrouridine synthase DusB [Bacteroidetes bacterium GWA2_30_7]